MLEDFIINRAIGLQILLYRQNFYRFQKAIIKGFGNQLFTTF